VCDRLHTDAVGAASAGLLGIWVNRRGDTPSAEDAAAAGSAGVLEIRGLAELPARLETRWAP